MFDDFLIRAIIAGIGVAAVAGPLGCLIVWRRMAYFGDTLSHAALLGVTLGLLLSLDSTLTVFAVCAGIAMLLLALQRRSRLSSDSILGLLAHAALAMGLVGISFLSTAPVDLMGLLIGDILAVSKTDVGIVYAGGAVVLAALAVIWRPLFAATVSPDIAEAETRSPAIYNAAFMLMTALFIAVAIKIVGVLLITALLIIPAAAARHISRSPEQMAVLAALVGVGAVVAGLGLSLEADTPSGPSIVVAAAGLFLVTLLARRALRRET